MAGVGMAIDVETTSVGTASAGDYDYDQHGHGYSSRRQADPRIAAFIHAALGPARTVLNVGAGAGSYEPEDRYVLAVEPSATMRAQRPGHLMPAIRGLAEALPLDDDAVDASMATLTVHQWADRAAGLREMRRVTRGAVVILTFDPDAFDRFWLFEYAPELAEIERRRFPSIATLCGALGEATEVRPVPIPLDCTDGFAEAFYGRPERWRVEYNCERPHSSLRYETPKAFGDRARCQVPPPAGAAAAHVGETGAPGHHATCQVGEERIEIN